MRIRLGTRGSALAIAQARIVAAALETAGARVEIVPIRTAGDERRAGSRRPADSAAAGHRGGDKARFVKEIEEALLAREVDLAVHSAKDVPSDLPDGLAIVGVPERSDARDALCGPRSLDDLPAGAAVGTSSLRRRAQLLALRPDLEVRELRGNVDTRLRRLAEGEFDALVLATAGLRRLALTDGLPMAIAQMTPAPGQGCLALEAVGDDVRMAEAAVAVTDRDSLVRLTAERALVAGLGASCRTPVGAHAEVSDGGVSISAFAGLPDGSLWVRDSLDGEAGRPGALGREVAERMLAAGAGQVLEAAERA